MIRVEVKWKHIRDGTPMDPRCCAVALALNDATGEKWTVITPSFYRIGREDHFYFNDEVLQWITMYDETTEEDRDTLVPIALTFEPGDDRVIAKLAL